VKSVFPTPYKKKWNDRCNLVPGLLETWINNSIDSRLASSPLITKVLCISVLRDRLKNWSGAPSPAAKIGLLSFNWIQSRVVTGLLTGNNTLRRHLYVMGLTNSPFRRRCGLEEETPAHVLCECETLATFRPSYLVSFFLEPWRHQNSIGNLELYERERVHITWTSVLFFIVTPCINEIKHFIVQLMHTTWKRSY
jgi:hypothetical protein